VCVYACTQIDCTLRTHIVINTVYVNWSNFKKLNKAVTSVLRHDVTVHVTHARLTYALPYKP
jgi:hypothetical protein